MACLTMQPRYHARPASFLRTGFPFSEVDSLFSLFDAPAYPGRSSPRPQQQQRTFQPRFDVRETPEAFHLQGELPGLTQDNVNIQFADDNTLTIHGKVVRESQRGDASLLENGAEEKALAGGEDAAGSEAATPEAAEAGAQNGYRKATVQDEEGDEASAAAPATPATTAPDAEKPEAASAEAPKASKARYWVSERSTGEFHRSFTFPGHVDHANVKASLKDGILNLEVPKAKAQEPRKIQIE